MRLFRISQKAFIRNDEGQLLLVRFSPNLHDPKLRGLWDIPGGGVEFGESLEEAFDREIKEEIGVEVKRGDLITVWDWIATAKPIPGKTYKSIDGNDYHGIVLAFDAHYIGGEIKLNEEHDKYEWIDPYRWREFNTGFELQKIERIWQDYLRWIEG